MLLLTLWLPLLATGRPLEVDRRSVDCAASLPFVHQACVDFLEVRSSIYLPEVGTPVVDTIQVVGGQPDSVVVSLGTFFVDVKVVLDPPPDVSGQLEVFAVRADSVANQFDISMRGLGGLDVERAVSSVSCWSYLYWADLEGVDLDHIELLEPKRRPWWLLHESELNPFTMTLWWELPEPPDYKSFVVALSDPGDL